MDDTTPGSVSGAASFASFLIRVRNLPAGAADTSDMVLAQALGEYGALSSILASFETAWLSLQGQISSVNSSTWAVVGLAALGMYFLWSRR